MSQNTVVYLAVDKDGTENMFDEMPFKNDKYYHVGQFESYITLPAGTIKKLTGKDLTWDIGYIEYVGDNYDPTPE